MSSDFGIEVGDNLNTQSGKDLKFTTKYSTLKIYKWDDVSFTTDGSGNATVSIPHGLNYAPAFQVERKCTASWTLLDATSYPNAFITLGSHNFWAPDDLHHCLHAYTNTTNLIITALGATPSTTYTFRYYIFVDLARSYSSSSGLTNTKDYGFAVAKQDKDVLTCEDYDLKYSSKYKALQFYLESRQSASLTLPSMNASRVDTSQDEGTYVDFYHGLGYPPLWQAEFTSNVDGLSSSIPYDKIESNVFFGYNVCGFCDSTRIRISFYRHSEYISTTRYGNWIDETITISVLPFTTNLLGVTNP